MHRLGGNVMLPLLSPGREDKCMNAHTFGVMHNTWDGYPRNWQHWLPLGEERSPGTAESCLSHGGITMHPCVFVHIPSNSSDGN